MRSKGELAAFLDTASAFYDGPVEGVYLRVDGDDGMLLHRAKLVRPDFVQNITDHWMSSTLVRNHLLF